MKWSQMLMIVLLILAQISFVFGRTSYEIKNLPATPYLFREINAPIAQDKIKNLQLEAHTHVEKLSQDAKKLPAKFEKRFFYRIDVVQFQLQDVGKVILKGSGEVPAKKIKTLPAGRYFVIDFEGPGSQINETFRRIPALLKEAGVKPDSPVITYYKNSALNSSSEKIRILIKLEDLQFVKGCAVLNQDGGIKQVFPGDHCHFYDDGSFVSANDNSVRMFSSQNEILWEVKGKFHHQMSVSADKKRIFGLTYYLRDEKAQKVREEAIIILSREGKILAERKLGDFMKFTKKWPVPIFLKKLGADVEASHLNSIYEIPANNSPLPYLKEGNIIVNSLYLGAFIFDPGMKELLKTIKLPSSVDHRVHDVQVTPDGKILYFNNSLKESPKIAAPEMFDPVSGKTTSLISDKASKLKSPSCGSVQILDKHTMMYAGIFGGPVFIDRKTGNPLQALSRFNMDGKENDPTFMIKLVPLSSFFQQRLKPRQ